MRTLRGTADDRPTICAPTAQPRAPRTVKVRSGPAPRRTQSAQYLRHAKSVAWGLAALAVIGTGWHLWRAGHIEVARRAVETTAAHAMVAAGLTVQDVELSGRRSTPGAQVLKASGLNRGDPILFVDLNAVRARIEQLGWVAQATVERRLPDTIHIDIVEREPFARWQFEGKTVLIDRAGVVLERDDPEAFQQLPRVVGAGAARAAARLFDMLQGEPALAPRVVNAVRVRDRRWDIEFDNGVVARLPEEGAEAAWRQLGALERDQRILGRDINTVDLRLPDRLVVRLTPEAAASRKTPGKNT